MIALPTPSGVTMDLAPSALPRVGPRVTLFLTVAFYVVGMSRHVTSRNVTCCCVELSMISLISPRCGYASLRFLMAAPFGLDMEKAFTDPLPPLRSLGVRGVFRVRLARAREGDPHDDAASGVGFTSRLLLVVGKCRKGRSGKNGIEDN